MAQIMSTFNAREDPSLFATDPRAKAAADWARAVLARRRIHVSIASADASFRRYFRVRTDAESFIVMDAPPEQESIEPYVDVAARLRSAKLNAPRVFAKDLDNGFALLDDFGDRTFLDAMAGDGPSRPLYADALAALVTMQASARADGLPPYDRARLATEMQLFRDWLVVRHLGLEFSTADEAQWRRTTHALCDAALLQPRVFVHRDYHSRNLMVVDENNPGILDFQDAMFGPVTYDLVSLLRDCYIALPASLLDELFDQYADAARRAGILGELDNGSLRTAFDLMGIQRHLKASGIFARLNHRDGKSGYLADIPRTLRYIVDVCESLPTFAWLQALVAERVLPAMQAARGDTPCGP